MLPIISLASPVRRRNQARRSIVEILHHLTLKSQLDAEARDMAARIVFCLREIADTVGMICEAWEERNR
jgi:hypothetical protein